MYEKGRIRKEGVLALSFRTIEFLGIREAAKTMNSPVKLAPLQTSLKQ